MKKFLFLLVLFLLIGCNKNEVEGIKIGNTLIENQTYSENQNLIKLIENVLLLDSNSLSALINFNCGEAAGCYDLGSVITQIIYKIGEERFMEMTNHLKESEKSLLKGFIEVGLEYGFPLDGKSKNERVENEFPIIYKNI